MLVETSHDTHGPRSPREGIGCTVDCRCKSDLTSLSALLSWYVRWPYAVGHIMSVFGDGALCASLCDQGNP